MIGTLINTLSIVVGSCAGLIFKKNMTAKYQTVFFQATGLFTLLLGVKMSIDMSMPLFVIISLVLGGFLGTKLKLDMRIEQFGDYLKTRTKLVNEHFTQGLVTGFLLFCMGSMTIVGAIEEGLGKTPDLLLTKSVIDFFSSMILAAGLGIGVLFSSIFLLIFQGGITILVYLTGKDIPVEMIGELSAVGGIMLIGLGINLLKIKDIKIINILPALILICVFVWLKTQFL
ncbi:MAG: DUF554 domain-containing protein [Prevotellaceae bacterium]|jgi:uncharacterized membrane protein YqgA involved in biofilm formation|nr:DUF554 domain-containing protein [Prevotellaceae bacterium]